MIGNFILTTSPGTLPPTPLSKVCKMNYYVCHHELILVEWLDTITYGCGKFLVGGHDHNLNNQSKEDDFRPQLYMAWAAESFLAQMLT